MPKLLCRKCSTEQEKKNRSRRDRGACGRCGGEIDDADYAHCSRCRQYFREYDQARRADDPNYGKPKQSLVAACYDVLVKAREAIRTLEGRAEVARARVREINDVANMLNGEVPPAISQRLEIHQIRVEECEAALEVVRQIKADGVGSGVHTCRTAILDLMVDSNSLSLKEIADALPHITRATVGTNLNRMVKDGVLTRAKGGDYSLKHSVDDAMDSLAERKLAAMRGKSN